MSLDERNGNLGPLPVGWVWKRLGDICEKPQYGWTTSAAIEGTLHLLRTTDITSGCIDWNTVPFCKDNPPEEEKYLLLDGDIVVSRAGSVGYSYLIHDPPDNVVFASYLIRFKPLVENKYVAYFLQSPSYWEAISEKSSGIAIPNVNATKLREIEVPLPPLPEQRRIVEAIERYFTRLDAVVAALERVQRNLARYKASVLQAACEGRLVPTEAALGGEYEPAADLLQRILAERRARWEAAQWQKEVARAQKKAAQAARKALRLRDIPDEAWQAVPEADYRRYLPKSDKWKEKYKAPQPPDTEGLPALPEGWVWATLDSLADIRGGVTKGRNLTKYKTVEVPYLRVANVQSGYLDLQEIKIIRIKVDELEKYLLYENDILFTEGGDRDKLGRGTIWRGEIDKCIHQNHVFSARLFDKKSVLPKWISFMSQVTYARDYFWRVARQTTNLASINRTKLGEFSIPIPPLAEQRRIVAEVERRLSVVEDLERTVEAALVRAARLRQSILKHAFAGRLV